jgi:hypothetical protein
MGGNSLFQKFLIFIMIGFALFLPQRQASAFEGWEHNLISNLSLFIVERHLCSPLKGSLEGSNTTLKIEKAKKILAEIKILKASLEENLNRDIGLKIPTVLEFDKRSKNTKCRIPEHIHSVIRKLLPTWPNKEKGLLHELKFSNFLQKSRYTKIEEDISTFLGGHENEDFSYGKVVEHIDFLLDPIRLLMNSNPLPGEFVENFPDTPADLKRFIVETDKTSNLLNASHNNGAHFQGHLLLNIRFWHKKAIEIATQNLYREKASGKIDENIQKRLFSTLLANAIGDHFLNDFFAPGHLLSPRDNFPDQPAMAIHDEANSRGAKLTLNAVDLKPLKEILLNMKKNGGCTENQPTQIAFGFRCKIMDDLSHKFGGEFEMPLYGDHELFYKDGALNITQGEDEIESQVLLMALTQARSILDVITPFLPVDFPGLSKKINHFDKYKWFARSTHIENDVLDWKTAYEVADLNAFCNEKNGEEDHPCGKQRLEVKEPVAGLEIGEYEFEKGDSQNVSPILGLDIAHESFLSGHKSSRWAFAIGSMPFGIPGSPDFLRDSETKESIMDKFPVNNIGLALNLNYIDGREYNAYGPGARLIWAFPKTDTQISAYYRYLFFNAEKDNYNRPTYGIRGEIGFSFLTAYLSLGRDYGLDREGNFDEGTIMSTGVTVSVPFSRIERFFNDTVFKNEKRRKDEGRK